MTYCFDHSPMPFADSTESLDWVSALAAEHPTQERKRVSRHFWATGPFGPGDQFHSARVRRKTMAMNKPVGDSARARSRNELQLQIDNFQVWAILTSGGGI
jgi:hypothetical protein